MTQGMIRMARRTPRPTNSRCSASAEAKPRTKAMNVDASVQISVFQVTCQNTSLVRMAV